MKKYPVLLLSVLGAAAFSSVAAGQQASNVPDQGTLSATSPSAAPLVPVVPPAALPPAATAPLAAPPPPAAQAQAVPPPLPAAITPPPLPPAAQYFYNDNGKPAGPFAIGDLGAKITGGAIKSDTLVWQAGTANWVAAKDLPAVAALLAVPAALAAPDFATYVLGTWQMQGAGPPGTIGPATLTVTFAKGGSLSGTYGVTVANTNAPFAFSVSGTWSASSVDAKHASLTLNMLITANGQATPSNSTASVEIVDDNTIRDTSDGTLSKRIAH